ncbi:MAG TPA: NAD(P)H-binding protein [Gaiellaceae bacterium]
MTVLVVGGTGFVGGHVVHALRAEELNVRVLARRPEKQERLLAWGCELVQGDMTDADSLRRAADGAKTIVHLVALPPFANPAAIRRVMEQGTRDLVAAAKESGAIRFVLMSALGTSERGKEISPYYHAKWEEEHEVAASGIQHTIFRPSFIFGRDGGMLPGLVSLVRWSPVTPVVGTKKFQPIWVDDVAAYFTKGVTSDEAANRTFEIGGPDVVTFSELNDRIRRALGKHRLAFQMPTGLLKAGATVGSLLPPLRGARDGVTMLEFEDNVTDIAPAVETLGVKPIGLDEQLRRATAST